MSQYLGDISAYALAVSQGYTGTEEEYAELMASYATVGQTAVTAAQTATTKASEAATSATTATNKATEATTAATTATTKAGEASTSASTATSAKDTAVSASQTATSKATEATTAAATATSAATTATTAKDDAVSAKTAAQTAQTGAETAAASVSASAEQIATNAADISQLKSELTDIRVGADGTTYNSAGAAVRGQISDLKGSLFDVFNASKVPIRICSTFANGIISSGSYSTSQKYRVSSTAPFIFESDIEVAIASGFRIYSFFSDDGVTYNSEGWIQTAYTFKKNKYNMLMIARVTENTSEIADIYTFTDAVTIASPIYEASKKALDSFEDMTIEGYERLYENMTGTVYANKMIGGSGNFVNDMTGWNVLEVTLTRGDQIKVTGTGAPVYVVKDSTGTTVIRKKTGSSFVDVTDDLYTALEDSKIYINGYTAGPSAKKLIEASFVKSNTGVIPQNVDGTYDVGDSIVNRVGVSSTKNKLFNFVNLYKSGSVVKPANDDIAPLYIGDVGYVGANHGYYYGYKITTTATLEETDIGQTAIDGDDTWVLIQTSPNPIIICYNSAKWIRMKDKAVPASLTFGEKVVAISNSSNVQIYPSVKNIKQEVIENGKGELKFLESYDIFNIGQSIDQLIEDAGANTNDSLAENGDAIYSVRNVYHMQKNGAVTVYQNLVQKSGTPRLAYYMGVQSMPFEVSGEGFVVLPSTQTSIQTANATVNFNTDMWVDENTPPKVFMQTNAGANNSTFAMILAFVNDERVLTSKAGEYNSSKKMYPYLTQPASYALKTYENISLRIPVSVNAVFTEVKYAGYAKVYDDYIMVIYADSNYTGQIELPTELQNRKVSKLDGNITLDNEVAINAIDVSMTAGQWGMIKFSK